MITLGDIASGMFLVMLIAATVFVSIAIAAGIYKMIENIVSGD